MDQKKSWSFVGLFMVILVLTIPFYAANALAVSVQITKNQGLAGMEHYIDAESDVWTVEALITDALNESIAPEQVRLRIGNNDAHFKSCTQSNLGVVCEYISPLTDGVQEAEHSFKVVYNFVNLFGEEDTSSNADYIRADGSAPTILFFANGAKQLKEKGDNQGKVWLDFTVNDKKPGVPSAGLKQIDIIDADTGAVLQTIAGFSSEQDSFNYLTDGEFGGILQASMSGEGKKKIKIRAEDNLGHVETSKYVQFSADFITPVIQDDLNLTRFGKFIGEFTGKTNIVVNVIEASVPSVIAYSEQADLNGNKAECDADDETDNLWHCLWEDVNVKPESTVKILVIATDEYGNKAEKTISKTLVVDKSAPKIKFFGTRRVFEEKSYLKDGEIKLILTAEDDGAGISQEGIQANLGVFGLSNYEEPTECTENEGALECYWEFDSGSVGEGVFTFGLSKFEDKVGNAGIAPEYEFFADNTGPKVEKIEVYGFSAAGDKDYFQSNDILKIVLTVSESSGLNVLVNANDLIMDAETKFPESEYIDEAGWQRFTEDSCKKEGGFWECVLETEAIKSGPDPSAKLEIKVQDTAGNDAIEWKREPKNVKSGTEGNYRIDLAGLSTEDNPDFWEVQQVTPLGGASAFVDLDTTPLTYARLPFNVKLETTNSNVEALNIEIIGCSTAEEMNSAAESSAKEVKTETPTGAAVAAGSAAPIISRNLLYGGSTPEGDMTPTPSVILEFEPFDGRSLFSISQSGVEFVKQEVEYVCQLKIFSRVGKNAVKAPELQDVVITVPFAFSTLGAEDENLAQKIEQAREEAETTLFELIGVLAKILKWINYLINVYQLVVSAIEIVTTAQAGFETLRETEAQPIAIAMCFGMNSASKSVSQALEIPNKIINVLTCQPDSSFGWYGTWQKYVTDYYNLALNEALGSSEKRYLPALDIRQNLYLSIAGLCLPGIIQNVDKYRQIKCRKIACLENEVAAGLATINMCDEQESLLTCKYFLGELWYVFPLSQFWDKTIGALYQAFKDPLAITHTLTIVTCGLICVVSNTLYSTCKYLYFIWDIVDWLESLAGFVTTMIAEFDQGGLNYCDSVL